ncbi:Uncharacterised protein [uncultured archaeon]|nr:Uncharacterised protein [uncultured archaeon]
MLSEEETEEFKQKIISQIESTFPEEQIDSAVSRIESMNSEEFEKFLEKNKIIKQAGENSEEKNECVFCSIASGKIKSVKISENEGAVAVLEINPISKGHCLVIAKSHSDKDSKEVSLLAKDISKKIKKKFKPKEVISSASRLFGHEAINLLPVYSEENFNSERKSASMEELEKIKTELENNIKLKAEKPKSTVEKAKEILWLPKRIP